MTWRKYFKGVNLPQNISPISGRLAEPGYRNWQSNLPEVYIGHPNRVERYNQYEQMDMDSEVNAALDILAEFMTQRNEENNTSFDIHFHETPTELSWTKTATCRLICILESRQLTTKSKSSKSSYSNG
jgi:hypothetical protein